jgi:prepilin-type N-terminal cleavage/methylation domain-containing protein
MKKKRGFTLIELLVVIAIIALLMAILMPALQRVKRQAKAVVCQANLRQWGTIFAMYMEENDSNFAYGNASGQWRWVLQSQYRERKLSVFCPEASNPDKNKGTFSPWGGSSLDSDYVMQIDYGSYGLNRWVYNRKEGQDDNNKYWKGRNVKGTDQIPLFMDCSWYGAGPTHFDDPPEYDGDTSTGGNWRNNNMRRVCLNRHNASMNSVFLDFAVRRIGLKELWTFKWNREYDVNVCPWTTAGGVQPSSWPQWMRSFKDY